MRAERSNEMLLNGENRSMSKPLLRDISQNQPDTFQAQQREHIAILTTMGRWRQALWREGGDGRSCEVGRAAVQIVDTRLA
jgi:hypothetical protein